MHPYRIKEMGFLVLLFLLMNLEISLLLYDLFTVTAEISGLGSLTHLATTRIMMSFMGEFIIGGGKNLGLSNIFHQV